MAADASPPGGVARRFVAIAVARQSNRAVASAALPTNLEWRDISGVEKVAQTRFGPVSDLYSGEGSTATVTIPLNGQAVSPPVARDGDYGIVSIQEVFALGDRDVVLLAATAGGSGSPPPLLLLLPVGAERPAGRQSLCEPYRATARRRVARER